MIVFLFLSGSQPTIAQLSLLKTATGGKIRIISQLAPHWRDLGCIMKFDDTGAEIQSIEQQYRGVPKDCCRAMFQHWLSGNGVRPCSWGTLIEQLEASKRFNLHCQHQLTDLHLHIIHRLISPTK